MLDIMPDHGVGALRDARRRNVFLKSSMSASHTSLAIGDKQLAAFASETMRLRVAQVGAVSGGTVTVQVQIDGRDIFDDANRPVSGGAAQDATSIYIIPSGSVVETIIEATSGTPTGTANVVIETEPYVLNPRPEPIGLAGRDRLFPSVRNAVARINEGAAVVAEGSALQRQAEGGRRGSARLLRRRVSQVEYQIIELPPLEAPAPLPDTPPPTK